MGIQTVPSKLLEQYPDYRMLISGNGVMLDCIVANPEFTSGVAVQTSSLMDDVNTVLSGLSSTLGKITEALSSADDKSSLSPYMSLKRWKGSTSNDFSIEFYVLENTREVEHAINTMVLPKTSNGLYVYEPMSLSGAMMDLIQSDDGLDAFMAKQKAKLFTVKIGKWFYAKYLICTNVSVNRKINVKVDGRPAYMRVSMQFEPIMDLTREEVDSWYL